MVLFRELSIKSGRFGLCCRSSDGCFPDFFLAPRCSGVRKPFPGDCRDRDGDVTRSTLYSIPNTPRPAGLGRSIFLEARGSEHV